MISAGRYKDLGETVDLAVNFAAAQTDYVLVAAPGIGKRVLLRYYEMSVGETATPEPTFTLKSDGSAQKGCQKYYPQFSGGTFDGVDYICDVNQALTLTTNISGNHSVYVKYNII